MKVAFNRRGKNPTTGPYIFVNRLAHELRSQDIEIVRVKKDHDIHFITMHGSGRRAEQCGAKLVQRIDGIYHDLSRDCNIDNAALKSTYHNVDAIVFQCNFAREMIYKHFGAPKKAKHEAVIYNAVSKDQFLPEGEKVDFGFEHTIICSGRWQPHKRLDSMIDGFKALDRQDTGLVILGNIEEEEQIKHPKIKYVGFVEPHELGKYYRAADVMLHLAFIDWCPNTVVEALACGVPVITTHNGGVPELVRDCGIVIQNELDYDMEFVDFKHLPKVDPELIANAINTIIDDKDIFVQERNDLYMDYCAKRYVDFFEKVVG